MFSSHPSPKDPDLWFSVTLEEQKMPDLSLQTLLGEELLASLWTQVPDIVAPLSNAQEAIDLLLQCIQNHKQCSNPGIQKRGFTIP